MGVEPIMDRSELLLQLQKGSKHWNSWRGKKPAAELPSLEGIVLEKLNLDGYDFSDISLKNARIESCSLRQCNFISADLRGAELKYNDFRGAKLIAARLDNANLSFSNLSQANLLTATVTGACLQKIDFRGHDLSTLDLRGTLLSGSNLEGQNLSNHDLSGVNLAGANLQRVNFTQANLNNIDFTGANLTDAILVGVSLKRAILVGVNLSGKDLTNAQLQEANLTDCDLRKACLKNAKLCRAKLTGAKLWRADIQQWDVTKVICEYAFWDESGREKTLYRRGEFERIYGPAISIELRYPYRLTPSEIATLPILIEHLEATYWGILLRLKSIQDVAGGALVTLSVIESDAYLPSELLANLQLEANRILQGQLGLHNNPRLRWELKEKIAEVKEQFWPRLLELAAEHEQQRARNLTILFMDLKGFSEWEGTELSEKLSLFRGLIKPILNRWKASYPNMEGDSLRATFNNATVGLVCACMMRDVLTSAGFSLRIGVEVGEVSLVHNEVTDLSDLEGMAVNMAARLESVAQPGEVLAGERVRFYADKKDNFLFHPKTVKLSKGVGDKKAGEVVQCYTVSLSKKVEDIF